MAAPSTVCQNEPHQHPSVEPTNQHYITNESTRAVVTENIHKTLQFLAICKDGDVCAMSSALKRKAFLNTETCLMFLAVDS